VRLGETGRTGQALAGLGKQGREHGEVRIVAAMERALDLAEPNGTVMAFLLHPAPGPATASCPAAHRPRRPWPAGILSLLAGQALGRPPGRGRCWRR
jgi:hypothetical protein